MSLVVERVGAQALVVDLGRPGWAHIGVTGAGALDRPAHRLVQRLVGNPEDAAGLEILLEGLALRCKQATTVALTGPPDGLEVHGHDGAVRRPGSHRAVRAPAGELVVVPPPTTGLRGYLAVSGGLAVAVTLGSRSADTLSGVGPAPLAAGDRLPLGRPATRPAAAEPVPVSVVGDQVELRVRLGPRADWLHDPGPLLRRTRWSVAPSGDRVGVRLEPDGAGFARAAAHGTRSCPARGW